MIKIISKLGINRLCVMFLILLYSVFMSESAFSYGEWRKDNVNITYNKNEHSITFAFLFYDWWHESGKEFAFLQNCSFLYSEDGVQYYHLMNAAAKQNTDHDLQTIIMRNKKPDEIIQFLNCVIPENGIYWKDDGKDEKVTVNARLERYKVHRLWYGKKSSYMSAKWYLPKSVKQIKSIKINGIWRLNAEAGLKFLDIYTTNFVN